jgi:DNA polymerase III alpha subunit
VYLNTHTNLSFKYGTLSPEDIFIEAQRLGIKKLALTEINNTASYIEMLRVIEERKDEYSLELAVGMEFREAHHLKFIALAKNNEGFAEINRYRHSSTSASSLSRTVRRLSITYSLSIHGAVA